MENPIKTSENTLSRRICTVPMNIPVPLKSLLSSVKDINTVDTADQVLDAMKDYIYKNDLYDKKNPRIIHCENDALKDVLGVPHFSLFEIKGMVLKLMFLENRANLKDLIERLTAECSQKRKVEDKSDDDDGNDDNKRQCVEGLEGGSSQINQDAFAPSYISSDEWSCFGDDDTLTQDSIIAVNHTFDIEYEIESDSSSIQSVTDTDSEIEDLVKVAAVTRLFKTDSDVEFWADRSSDECFDDSDLEIPDSDKWVCKTCSSRNKPLNRYCLKCWNERIGWSEHKKERRMPPRKKNCSRKNKGKKLDLSDSGPSTSMAPGSSQELFSSTLSSSQELGESSQEKEESSTVVNLCALCMVSPENAAIIHGNTAHQFGCYRCARKLMSLKKPCPLCRKTIERVVHLFLSRPKS